MEYNTGCSRLVLRLKIVFLLLKKVRYFQAWTESISPDEQLEGGEGEDDGGGEWGTFSTTPAGKSRYNDFQGSYVTGRMWGVVFTACVLFSF